VATDRGARYPDLSSACKYVLDSFVQMFPEYECGEASGVTSMNARGPVS
jgi:hypothetical protein